MSRNSDIPYITHSLKGRHGTHAPFVYDFVCQVLRGPSKFKTFLGRYFFPVTYIKDEQEILHRFEAFYQADTTIVINADTTSEQLLLSIRNPEIKRVFIRQTTTQKNVIHIAFNSLNKDIQLAYWVPRHEMIEDWHLYFDRAFQVQNICIYFKNKAFLQKELFLLK